MKPIQIRRYRFSTQFSEEVEFRLRRRRRDEYTTCAIPFTDAPES